MLGQAWGRHRREEDFRGAAKGPGIGYKTLPEGPQRVKAEGKHLKKMIKK